MKKKLIFVFMSILFLLTASKTIFAADMKYIYQTKSDITKGAALTSYEIFMSDRRFNTAYVATADLSYPHLSLGVLSNPQGTKYLTTVSQMAKNSDATIAINADFFNWGEKSGQGSPIGAVFFDKKFHSSPSTNKGMYTIMQDMSQNVFADIIDYKITITAPHGEQRQLGGKNKASDLSQIMMYDNLYDTHSLGSTETLYEIVVTDDIVTEIRFSSEPVELKDNMYVLAGLSDHDTFLLDNFKIGDKIVLTETSSIDFDNISLAVGAGALLVENGKALNTFSHNVSGTNPRSALGISKDGRKLYFTVVEGRTDNSSGMSMSELAAFMKYIGAHTAVNLDGGGSSTLVTKNLKDSSYENVNVPSDGAQRKVSSSLAIISSAEKTSILKNLKLDTKSENVFVGSGIDINTQGFDEYYYPVDVNENSLTYSVSGVNGYFKENTFFPKSAGEATITAKAKNGAAASIKLNVLGTPYKIENSERKIEIGINSSKEINLLVTDINGYSAPVSLSDMVVNFSDSIAHVKDSFVVGDRRGCALMSAKFGDAVIYMSVNVGKSEDIIPLPADKTAVDTVDKTDTSLPDDYSMRFAVFGNVKSSDTLFNNIIMKTSLSKINANAQKAFILTTKATDNIEPNISIPTEVCYPFRSFAQGNNKFIILDSEDSFMSSKEWNWFIDEIQAVNGGNLFVFMQTQPSFVIKKETKLFNDLLSEASKRGADVYVFCIGDTTSSTVQDGVRYIQTPGFSESMTTKNFLSMKDSLKYILVDIAKDDSVSYRFIPIY